jgi:hypothetical protein
MFDRKLPPTHFYDTRFETVFTQQSEFVLVAESIFSTERFVTILQTSRGYVH